MDIHPHRRFAIIGAAGYIAPRHFNAMKSLGQELTAAHDLFDSVGIIDRFFPNAYFTTDKEDFRKYISTDKVDILTVCSPNYLHCSHVILGLQTGNDVICEKPIALTPEEIQLMNDSQKHSGHNVWTILQLRVHPEIIRLRHKVETSTADNTYDIDLTYITPRGNWYAASWKGTPEKSGGLVANIGFHFIDMLNWIFGKTEKVIMHHCSYDCAAGILYLKKARVRFLLSINPKHRPNPEDNPMAPYRSIVINGNQIDFTNGFTDLHTISYDKILKGEGITTYDTLEAMETLWTINNTISIGVQGDYHPLARQITNI